MSMKYVSLDFLHACQLAVQSPDNVFVLRLVFDYILDKIGP